jgi:4-hydroxybenzoate polyprenyltransferase
MATRTRRRGEALAALLAAAHIGPAVAVTVVAALLTVAAGLAVGDALTVTAAVLAGQLTIGWGNDLLDARRDREAGRQDKPIATGAVSARLVSQALVAAAVACVVLSALLGPWPALVHLVLLVGAGHAYNLGLKSTVLSWLPYAVAFGSLPAVVWLADDPPAAPPWWAVLAGAALGVGAHFLNTLPDLADDAATGVRGLPHRLGATGSRVAATALLVLASIVTVLGAGRPPVWGWVGLGLVLVLAVVALAGRGRVPFRAAMLIAMADVALVVAVGRGAG